MSALGSFLPGICSPLCRHGSVHRRAPPRPLLLRRQCTAQSTCQVDDSGCLWGRHYGRSRMARGAAGVGTHWIGKCRWCFSLRLFSSLPTHLLLSTGQALRVCTAHRWQFLHTHFTCLSRSHLHTQPQGTTMRYDELDDICAAHCALCCAGTWPAHAPAADSAGSTRHWRFHSPLRGASVVHRFGRSFGGVWVGGLRWACRGLCWGVHMTGHLGST